MKTRGLIAILVLLLFGAGAVILTLSFFLLSARSALDTPNPAAIAIAEAGKVFLIPPEAQSAKNPITASPDVLSSAHRLFTTRCSICHGSDGKGDTPIGSHIYPRAADLTASRTQSKSDGALAWIIGNGIPHTGMPGWKQTLKDEDIWQLVTYVRALPNGVPPETAPAASGAQPAAGTANTVTMTINNYTFVPSITVATGTKVVWVNKDDETHTVTSEGEPSGLDSPEFKTDQTYEFTFSQPGTYKYMCRVHNYMHGEVVVVQ